MCCIFTCCGWVLDLIQRFWTFAMSCCIAGAGSCVIITASVSGITMGYNYALAEYVDLKETNVSVYLKRGVFDDEIQDDMDWRRSGHMPIAGHIASDNLRTGALDEEYTTPLRSGRRLDDSVIEGNVNNQYEGSLMRLTAKIPLEVTTSHHREDTKSETARRQFSDSSINELKAIQNLIDARRNIGAGARDIINQQQEINQRKPIARWPEHFDPGLRRVNEPESTELSLSKMIAEAAKLDGQAAIRRFRPGARRMDASDLKNSNDSPINPLDSNEAEVLNSARLAVPSNAIGNRFNWLYPRVPYMFPNLTDESSDYRILPATYPSPIPLNVGPKRPPTATTPVSIGGLMFVTRTVYPTVKPGVPLNELQAKSDANPKHNVEESFKELLEHPSIMNKVPKKDKAVILADDDYEEVNGLPVRRRRSILQTIFKTYIPLNRTKGNNEMLPRGGSNNIRTISSTTYTVNDVTDTLKLLQNIFKVTKICDR